MAEIKPFNGIVYNKEKIADFSKVACPPYDIISPKSQDYYHSLSPHNMIHLILGKDLPGEDKYERASRYFNQWIKEKIMVREEKETIYFYLQQYNIKGEKKTRLGFIALLRLDEKNSSIFPHEHTRIEPKEDRLRLLREVKANLSPIFVLFNDDKRIIQRTYEQYILKEPPFIEIVDEEKTLHKLWRITEGVILDLFQKRLSDKNIFIADGHHRYEVALQYRDQMRQELNDYSPGKDFNYIMAYFTNVQSKGLLILPIHRFVKGIEAQIPELQEKFSECFDTEEIKEKEKFFFLMEKSGLRQPTLGMYKNKRFFLLRLKSIRILDKIITNKPKEYRSLDVSILNYLMLNKSLGIDPDDKNRVIYIPDSEELMHKVDNERTGIGFLLNPVRIGQILEVSLKGERLPPKTTYFYPKVLSGLVINKLEG